MKDSKSESRIKCLRLQAGFSQEELANKTQLSLRTIQRIENGETVPRGDSLQRISRILNFQVADLIEQPVQKEDKGILLLLNVSVLGFLLSPLLGLIFPVVLWLIFKDKITNADVAGRKIVKAQMYWLAVLFSVYLYMFFLKFFNVSPGFHVNFNYKLIITGLYLYNLIIIAANIIKIIMDMSKGNKKPAVSF